MTTERGPINLDRIAADCERIANRKNPVTPDDLYLLARGIVTLSLGRTITFQDTRDQSLRLPLAQNMALIYRRHGFARFVNIERVSKDSATLVETTETIWLRQEKGKFKTLIGSVTMTPEGDPHIHPYHEVELTAEQKHNLAKEIWEAYQTSQKKTE